MATGHSKWLLITIALITCITLSSSCSPLNSPPIISSVHPEKTWVEPSGRCQIECVATDPDGDELTYQWSATGGNIAGIGSIINWIAPNSRGIYTITVVVTDGRGGEAKMDLTTIVLINHAPIIESLTAEQRGCDLTESTPIECIAFDPDGDELTYQWSTTGGELTGEGSSVIWTAPEVYDTYYVTVTVTDGRGGETSDQLSIRVRQSGSGGG